MKRRRIERAGIQEVDQASDMGLSPISPGEGGGRAVIAGNPMRERRRSALDRLMPTPFILPSRGGDGTEAANEGSASTSNVQEQEEVSSAQMEEGTRGRRSTDRRSFTQRLAALLPSGTPTLPSRSHTREAGGPSSDAGTAGAATDQDELDLEKHDLDALNGEVVLAPSGRLPALEGERQPTALAPSTEDSRLTDDRPPPTQSNQNGRRRGPPVPPRVRRVYHEDGGPLQLPSNQSEDGRTVIEEFPPAYADYRDS